MLPRVTVGIPVYNSERFLRATLDSLLAQDHSNLHVVLSDDASTDGSIAIAEEYASRDPRITVVRNAQNQGWVRNFNRLLEFAEPPYFMWAGDHDLWHPTFVSRCVAALESQPDLSVAYSRARYIDETGAELMDEIPDLQDMRTTPPLTRYLRVIWLMRWVNVIYGVIRVSALRQTAGLRQMWGPDHLLIAELALQGGFARLDEPLFWRRRNRVQETRDEWKRRGLFFGREDPRLHLPMPELYRELRDAHVDLVRRSPALGPFAKRWAALSTAICFLARFRAPWTPWPLADRAVDFALHRLRLRRLLE